MKRFVMSALIGVAVTFAGPVAAKNVVIHGSTTVANNVLLPHKGDIEKSSGHMLKVVANGSSRGVKAVANGKADLGMVSSPLDSVVAKINKKKPGSVDGNTLQAHKIGETKVAFIVHASNGVSSLSLEQVAGILTGAVTNWKDVGGKDAPIVVVAEDANGGIRTLVEKKLLSKKEMTPSKFKQVPNGSQVAKVVNQIPQSFGVSTPASVTGGAKTVKTDKDITQPLILVSKGNPAPELAAVIDAARNVSTN